MSLAPKTRLGPYEILAPLGAGGMGEVYRARDTRLGRDVAVKVLPQHLSLNPEVRARFEREAQTVSALNHPHICTLFDVGREGDTDFLVMELIEGETLAARLERGALPAGEVTKLGAQIADALSRAHRAGVVHRDLKPGNIMLTKSGAKLLDFGLARAADPATTGSPPSDSMLSASPTVGHPLTAEGTIVGTTQYMAPEQLEGREADARSDVWSLGCVLYEMATGRRPFEGASRASLIAAILEREPAPMTSVRPTTPPALDRLVQACMAKDPDDRLQSAQDVKLQLEWMRGDSTASGGSPAAPARGRRKATGWIVAASLAVGLVAAFLVGRQITSGRNSTGTMEFQRRTYRNQTIFSARFLRDARTLVLSAALTGNRPRLFVLRADSPEPQTIGPEDVHLLAVSSRGELAVLTHARFTGHHRLFEGTLSRMPLEGAAPRELMSGVREADWSPDGEELAVIHEVAGKDRLEYPVGTVLHESGGYLSDIRVSPKGDAIAFMEHPSRWDDRGSVNVVGLRGPARVLADGYSAMEGLAWSASGQSVLFSATVNGSEFVVQEVDRSGKIHARSRDVGLVVIHDIAPDGTWAVTRDEIPTRLSFRASGAKEDVDLSWLDSALQPSLSGDGKTLALTDQSIMAGAGYSAIVRSTSGGPIVRLGEGVAEQLSPDGKSVVAIVLSSPPHIVSYPVGTGTPTRLDQGTFENISCVRWMPDGARLLVCGNEPGKATQSFLVDPASKRTTTVGPEGAWEGFPAPDGTRFAVRSQDGWLLCSVSGTPPPRPIPTMTAVDELIRWSPDASAVFCFPRGDVPAKVDRIDLASGRRETVAVVGDRDQAGLVSVLAVTMADDQKTMAFGTWYYTSTLYTVDFSR